VKSKGDFWHLEFLIFETSKGEEIKKFREGVLEDYNIQE